MRDGLDVEVERVAGGLGVRPDAALMLVQTLLDEGWIEEVPGEDDGVVIERHLEERGMNMLRRLGGNPDGHVLQ